jgi:hypothetical protein
MGLDPGQSQLGDMLGVTGAKKTYSSELANTQANRTLEAATATAKVWLPPLTRAEEMKRRTLKRFRLGRQPEQHHHVYVVLLNSAVAKIRKVRIENPQRDPAKPCVYVGMTGLTPKERFANHKAGIKAASVVKRHGLRLLPELYEHLNPMPYEAAARMEMDLAEDLRRAGYLVAGGH